MPIVRVNDPRKDDIRHQILTRMGKLCDQELSFKTKQSLMDELTGLLKGEQLGPELFKKLDVEFQDVEGPNGRVVKVHIPMNYVSASIGDINERRNQWLEFDINKATNITNTQDHPIEVENQ